jgi:hypothetical protein
MPRFRLIVDAPLTTGWPENIGKLILNFSAVEFESVHWLVQLSMDVKSIPAFAQEKFTKRIKGLKSYIKHCAPDKAWADAALQVWTEAREIAKIRNRIAHNPLVFGWTKDPPMGEPDLIGLPDMSRPENPTGSADPLMSSDELLAAINKIPPLVRRMGDLRIQYCAHRDAHQTTCADGGAD